MLRILRERQEDAIYLMAAAYLLGFAGLLGYALAEYLFG
jgi:hypothetical protein